MFPPPPARSQYSVLIRVRVRGRVRRRVGVGVRGKVGFKDSVGVLQRLAGRGINSGFRSMPLPGGRACAAKQAASNGQCMQDRCGRAVCTVEQAQGAFRDPEGGGGWGQGTGRCGGWAETQPGPVRVGGWGTQPSVQRTHYATQSGS